MVRFFFQQTEIPLELALTLHQGLIFIISIHLILSSVNKCYWQVRLFAAYFLYFRAVVRIN